MRAGHDDGAAENGEQKLLTHYLYPSTLFASRTPHLITTVLGTCVSLCLWDTRQKFGGMNHYMLPLWNGNGLATPKFGNIAIAQLIERMEQLGSRRADLIAKVFGGKANHHQNELLNVGERNARLAEHLLADAKIAVTSRSLGDFYGRKILFETATGEVRLKRIVAAGDQESGGSRRGNPNASAPKR